MTFPVPPKIIALMGPTATGKTALAVSLAKRFPVEIISVDSALVYRGMNIGTAKPGPELLRDAPHRLIDICDPATPYSVGQFCQDAILAIHDILAKGHIPLLVGGTMLYFHQLFFGLATLPKRDEKIREKIAKRAEAEGWAGLHQKLSEIDPAAAQKIKPQDPQRIQRALEVFYLTGMPLSTLQQQQQSPYFSATSVKFIALLPEDRAWLHHRIEQRFEEMLSMGFIEEVRALKNRGDLHPDLPALRVVGYRQVWEYLEGKYDENTMKAKALAATRQLAKRQMTWLRHWRSPCDVVDPQGAQMEEQCARIIQHAFRTN
ncbi:MAG: tRNA (adenosine(37)-N6)-dimethylallyltransferase MiaA [Gammaproteobacteria bacterium RIFCSPHIGHO2_12_FULL_42_13]|nr:MAG: tRNA (adenosine(37)-N6)-dimethylallyltransferase MiaA [Gammaproteobacteria bacterium RIFCSPHIGHO2_12_FULL_42_13]